jgi:hypothetical protein
MNTWFIVSHIIIERSIILRNLIIRISLILNIIIAFILISSSVSSKTIIYILPNKLLFLLFTLSFPSLALVIILFYIWQSIFFLFMTSFIFSIYVIIKPLLTQTIVFIQSEISIVVILQITSKSQSIAKIIQSFSSFNIFWSAITPQVILLSN